MSLKLFDFSFLSHIQLKNFFYKFFFFSVFRQKIVLIFLGFFKLIFLIFEINDERQIQRNCHIEKQHKNFVTSFLCRKDTAKILTNSFTFFNVINIFTMKIQKFILI